MIIVQEPCNIFSLSIAKCAVYMCTHACIHMNGACGLELSKSFLYYTYYFIIHSFIIFKITKHILGLIIKVVTPAIFDLAHFWRKLELYYQKTEAFQIEMVI